MLERNRDSIYFPVAGLCAPSAPGGKYILSLFLPRTLGAPLKGEHEGYWRWRMATYRVIARIEDERITILVGRVAHRREAYR
jgi:mRNA-degrading endonuclease RelE of RelBE toxin-antitoxin system